jgi:Sulfotransferase domain
MTTPCRIVQIGFNRAGTSSIADFLRRSGFSVVDHRFDRGALKGNYTALLIENNISKNRAPLHGLEAWTGFTDMEYVDEHRLVYAQNWFREIAASHPETKFILNLRDKAAWLHSRKNFGGYMKTCAKASGVSETEALKMWSLQWDTHIAAVRQYFSADRLLVLNIDDPDEEALNKFIGSKKSLHLRQKNKAPRGPISRFLNFVAPKPVTIAFPQPFKNWLKNY